MEQIFRQLVMLISTELNSIFVSVVFETLGPTWIIKCCYKFLTALHKLTLTAMYYMHYYMAVSKVIAQKSKELKTKNTYNIPGY